VAKKAQKRSAPKKASTKSAKAAPRPAAKTTKARVASTRASAPAQPATRTHGAGLHERARRLHEEILRSKLTHPNPWTYAPKARAWGERAQVLVELIVVQGHTPGALRTLETLHAEVERDHDFQQARRLF
jgi:outer membrane biosynthesis protein TonB